LVLAYRSSNRGIFAPSTNVTTAFFDELGRLDTYIPRRRNLPRLTLVVTSTTLTSNIFSTANLTSLLDASFRTSKVYLPLLSRSRLLFSESIGLKSTSYG